MRRRVLTVCVCALVLPGALGGPGTASAQRSDPRSRAAALRIQIVELRGEADEKLAEYEKANAEYALAVTKHQSAKQVLGAVDDEGRAERDRQAARARALYASGGQVALYVALLQADTLGDLFSRYANVASVLNAGRIAQQENATTARRLEAALEMTRAAAAASALPQRAAAALALQVGRKMAEAQRLLDEADAEVRALIEAERRARLWRAGLLGPAAATPWAVAAIPYQPADGAAYACPVGPVHSFVDTWLAPRSGGRRHQGTDVFAPEGSSAVAVTSGVIDKWSSGGLGGIALWLRADNGDRFYYAHNSANLASVGTRVAPGDVIARVGDTGNAEGTPPHVHFEAHPGGGAAANPYPFLRAICER